MARRQRRYAFSQWSDPLPIHPVDAARWATYCIEINGRIEQVREDEGHESWRTFGVDLLDFGPRCAVVVGRVVEPNDGSFGSALRRAS